MRAITKKNIPVRENPGLKVKFTSNNEEAEIIDEYSDFLDILYDKKQYRTYSKLIKKNNGDYITIDANTLSNPNDSIAIEQEIPKDKIVKIKGTHPKWYKLKFTDCREGWAHKNGLRIIND